MTGNRKWRILLGGWDSGKMDHTSCLPYWVASSTGADKAGKQSFSDSKYITGVVSLQNLLILLLRCLHWSVLSFSLGELKLQLRGSHCQPGAAPGCQGWCVLCARAANTRSPISGVLGEAGHLKPKSALMFFNSRAFKGFVVSRKLCGHHPSLLGVGRHLLSHENFTYTNLCLTSENVLSLLFHNLCWHSSLRPCKL